MKYLLVCVLLCITWMLSPAQQRIHAHNDYQKPAPLTNALQHKVFSIEADIFLSGNRILVAHDKKELPTAQTLDSLYLQPIIELFKKNKGTITADNDYVLTLMIDIKENGEAVITELIKLLSAHPSEFDRLVNPRAVQIVISGDRGASTKWNSYPSYILFDGRPYEVYDSAALQRVAFVSDSYSKYINSRDSVGGLSQLIIKVHGMNKLLRVWAHPDHPSSWLRLQQLGIDIINTDRVEECKKYFMNKGQD